MDTANAPDLTRSEAFAEDIGAGDDTPAGPPAMRPWMSLLPLIVALLGVAFAVVPPLP